MLTAVFIWLCVLFSLPIGAIWAVNILFEMAIPITVQTWFAALILIGIVSIGSD